jgi:asparagine synthase (glutamine-hydrolysing)
VRNREWQSLLTETSSYAWLRPSPLPGIWRRAKNLFGKDPTSPEYPRWLAPDFARRLNLQERAKQWPAPVSPPHPVLTEGHASLSQHWSHMFELENAGVTRCPVEVRHPFFDLRIVNFLLSLPPFPLFFEKRLLREAVAGRLPESIRTRRKSPLAGDPLAAHLRERDMKWLDQRTWSEEMESYVDTSVLATLRRERRSGTVEANFRPICFNFWLQSARRVRYNLHAEVRNG